MPNSSMLSKNEILELKLLEESNKPQEIKSSMSAQDFLEVAQQLDETVTGSTYVLCFGLPNSGKTHLLGGLVHYFFNQKNVSSQYQIATTTRNSDRLFFEFLDYFTGVPEANSLLETRCSSFTDLRIHMTSGTTGVKEQLNFVDWSGLYCRDILNIANQQSAENTSKDNHKSFALDRLRSNLFPDYITAILESNVHLHILFVIDPAVSTCLDPLFELVLKELQEYKPKQNYRVGAVLSKSDSIMEQSVIKQKLNSIIPATMQDVDYFCNSGFLSISHRNKFTDLNSINPTILAIANQISRLH